jgi:hypothetical protein
MLNKDFIINQSEYYLNIIIVDNSRLNLPEHDQIGRVGKSEQDEQIFGDNSRFSSTRFQKDKKRNEISNAADRHK